MESEEGREERVRRLRDTIAHFEHLLETAVSAELAKTYRAELAAARAMLDEIEHRSPH